MHRTLQNRTIVQGVILGLLLGHSSASASVVQYSTCPGYPLTAYQAEWYSAAIPDNNASGVTIELYVPSDGENFILDVNPWVFITHSYQGDLRIVLTSPAGTSVDLVNRPGSPGCGGPGFSADNFGYIDGNFFLQEFVLDDQAVSAYNSPAVGCPGIANVDGSWRSPGALGAFYGESKVGPWRLFIQDLAGADVGTLWVWGMTITTEPVTPSVVDIAMPEDYACGCAGGAITGTASDPDGTFSLYTLEWSTDSAGPWTLIASSASPVVSGVLGTFPAAMPEGYSYVRLMARNTLGLTSTFIKVIHQDRVFDGAVILEPVDGAILGGGVCLDRVAASDYCFASAALAYRPAGGPFTTFYSTNSPVQEFPPWSTTGLPDGDYTLRVSGTTTCGNAASDEVQVTIDNAAPVAVIASPDNCDKPGDSVTIIGTATDAHFGGWTLQYTGGPANGWQTIASGVSPVNNNVLATWDTSALPACSYTLRLLVSDASIVSCIGSNSAEFLVSIELGDDCPADIDGSGDVSNGDLQMILDNWADVCPP
jgi:subtilisin-like proprotein convertase family protein